MSGLKPSTKPSVPTKAQAELLVWIVARAEKAMDSEYYRERELAGVVRGGDLIDYYQERFLRSRRGNMSAVHWTAGSPKVHAWRRAGGTALKNLCNRGFVEFVHYAYGVPEYKLTDLGRRAVEI